MSLGVLRRSSYSKLNIKKLLYVFLFIYVFHKKLYLLRLHFFRKLLSKSIAKRLR